MFLSSDLSGGHLLGRRVTRDNREIVLNRIYIVQRKPCQSFRDPFGLYGQVNKRARWMPRQSEAMKDVVTCEKLRGGGKQPMIRRYLNGETHPM